MKYIFYYILSGCLKGWKKNPQTNIREFKERKCLLNNDSISYITSEELFGEENVLGKGLFLSVFYSERGCKGVGNCWLQVYSELDKFFQQKNFYNVAYNYLNTLFFL